MEKCFWCDAEKECHHCECGRFVCDNCDDDGSCHEGDCCPHHTARMVHYYLLHHDEIKAEGGEAFFDIIGEYQDKNYKFVIKSLELLIEMLNNSKWSSKNPPRCCKDFIDKKQDSD